MQKSPRSKKLGASNKVISSSFITHLEHAKCEKRTTKGKELVQVPEDSETVKSFLHRINPFKKLHYRVFSGDVANMLDILPKRHYTFVLLTRGTITLSLCYASAWRTRRDHRGLGSRQRYASISFLFNVLYLGFHLSRLVPIYVHYNKTCAHV